MFAIVIGLFCALIRHYKVPVLSTIAGGYIEFFRNTPLLVQLFFLYFGLPKLGIRISPEGCAVIGLTFLGSSYMAEAFRSGLESVDLIQWESAQSLGLTRRQTMRYVIIPPALKNVLPALANEFIVLLKDTSLITVIGGKELLYAAQGIMNRTYEAMFPLLGVAVVYLVLVMLFTWLLLKFERRMAQGDR